jgi:hypothetical protein
MTGGPGQLAAPSDRVVLACVAQPGTAGGGPVRTGDRAGVGCFIYIRVDEGIHRSRQPLS